MSHGEREISDEELKRLSTPALYDGAELPVSETAVVILPATRFSQEVQDAYADVPERARERGRDAIRKWREDQLRLGRTDPKR